MTEPYLRNNSVKKSDLLSDNAMPMLTDVYLTTIKNFSEVNILKPEFK
jgi:hypothetical protein